MAALLKGGGMTDYVAIIVPSTRRFNEPLSDTEARDYVQRTIKFLAGLFGGATAIQAEGAWFGSAGVMVAENTTLVFSFAANLSDDDLEQVAHYCRQIRHELEQESIGTIVNGEMFFVV
jgi:hypothetical protein